MNAPNDKKVIQGAGKLAKRFQKVLPKKPAVAVINQLKADPKAAINQIEANAKAGIKRTELNWPGNKMAVLNNIEQN